LGDHLKVLNWNFDEIHTAMSIKVLSNLLKALDFDLKSVDFCKRSFVPKYAVTGAGEEAFISGKQLVEFNRPLPH